MEQKFTLTPSSYNTSDLIKRVEDILTIVKFYTEDEMTLHEISDIYGIHVSVVYDILLANGVKTRKRGPKKCSQC